MKKFVFILLIVNCTLQIAYSQSGWFWQNPYPTPSSIYYAKMFNASTGIFYDNTGYMYKTTNGGNNWNNIFSFHDFNYSFMTSVYIYDQSFAFMCLDSTGFLITTNGGNNWTVQSQYGVIDNPKPIFLNQNTGIVYGTNYRSTSSIIKRTTNQGLNWATVLSDTNFIIKDIQFSSAQTGYAAGFITQGLHFKLLKTTNSGASWDSIPNAMLLKPNCIFFTDDNTGFLSADVGYAHFYKTTNGGVNWSVITSFNNIGIHQLLFLNPNTGYLLTNNIYKTTDAGISWSFVSLYGISGNNTLRKMEFIDDNNFFCFGDGGFVIKSSNGGADWSQLSRMVTNNWLWEVAFANQNTGFIVGEYSTILKTTNGGEDWILTQFPQTDYLNNVAMVDSDHWFLSEDNGKVFRTTNGGASWDTTYSNAPQITRLKFVNQLTGFGVCKYNNFIKTTNGGQNWIIINLLMSQNWAMDFANELTGFAGSDKVKKTTDGGLIWDTLSFPVHLYTSDIQFINQNVCYICGYDNYGMVYKTTNCGVTWQIVLTTPQSRYLNDLYFINEQTGYVTDGGTLYKTTNGGINWTQHNLLTGIYTMYFTNELTGYGVGNYGTIIKTTTGGGEPIGIQPISNELPISFVLHQNYPNPFNPVTKIKFSLPANVPPLKGERGMMVKLIIYDVTGREVATLINEQLSPGTYEVSWDGTNFASGVYFYQLISGDPSTGSGQRFIQTKKMVLLK